MNAGWDLRVETLRIPFRDPLVIARYAPGEGYAGTSVVVELRSPALPGLVGIGEGCPDTYYGETAATIAVVMDLVLGAVPPETLDLDGGVDAARAGLIAIGAAFDDAIRGNGAAKCALDIALHDLAGKALGLPIHRLLGLSPEIPPTPIVADESALTIEDLDALVGVVDGVNVKLAKCGGVGPAARMLARARELGFRTFLGCMEETSVAIAVSAAVASLAEWVDLDGCLLLADDPFMGLELGDDCRWRLTDAPGHGVTRRATG